MEDVKDMLRELEKLQHYSYIDKHENNRSTHIQDCNWCIGRESERRHKKLISAIIG